MTPFGIAVMIGLGVISWVGVRAWKRQALTHTSIYIARHQSPVRYAIGMLRLAGAAVLLAMLVWLAMSGTRGNPDPIAAPAFAGILALICVSVPVEGLATGRFTWRNSEIVRAANPVWFWLLLTFATTLAVALLVLTVASLTEILA